jgi:hypothetical protein
LTRRANNQAAELPVKAKPVEYVKICTLYGAGFYYMPGTDMCPLAGNLLFDIKQTVLSQVTRGA